jgi:hypothetical protein
MASRQQGVNGACDAGCRDLALTACHRGAVIYVVGRGRTEDVCSFLESGWGRARAGEGRGCGAKCGRGGSGSCLPPG